MKELFHFTRSERRGIIVLILLILIVFLSGYAYRYWRDRRPPTEEELRQQALLCEEYRQFKESLQALEAEQQSYPIYTPSTPKTYRQLTPQPFDPNTADSVTFVRMGLPDWMAHNIVKYRSRGGHFRKPEDFRKIYGLTEEQYNVLLPYICLSPDNSYKSYKTYKTYTTYDDSVPATKPYERTEKYPAGTVLELNSADTTELKRIPGIGSTIARMIVSQRQRLGGYYCLEQLGEIRLKYEQLRPWFSIDTTKIERIPVNRRGVEQLRRHPYINFYQARAIVEYRHLHGDLKSLRPFILYEEFTDSDLNRLSHYLSFE